MASSGCRVLFCALALLLSGVRSGTASDHDDTPLLKSLPRHDARLTDFFVFLRADRLVLVLAVDPTIAASVTEYTFARDLTLRFHVDNDSEVRFDDPEALRVFGGTVVRPEAIEEELVFEITFEREGAPHLRLEGLPASAGRDVHLFVGLRDDPFIRGPRIGRNVAVVVLELPLSLVRGPQSTLLLWATSKVPEMRGPYSDLAGRAIRSQMPENLPLNTLHPRNHYRTLGVPPDVVIFDTARPAALPNGRELTDDVVDLVGDLRVLGTDAPFPSQNDVPFLEAFPYLAGPH